MYAAGELELERGSGRRKLQRASGAAVQQKQASSATPASSTWVPMKFPRASMLFFIFLFEYFLCLKILLKTFLSQSFA